VLFLLFAAITGVIVAFTEFFGADESAREALRKVVSPVTLSAPAMTWTAPLEKAVASAATRGNSPVDKVEIQFKGTPPTVTIYTGKRGGGEDRKLVFDARTGALLSDEAYADKPFLYRLHSGEAFGDGGLVVAMLWGTTLVIMGISGFLIYWHMVTRMRVRHEKGMRRFFW
jgi:uncharacterized iron-regulated membrane protein